MGNQNQGPFMGDPRVGNAPPVGGGGAPAPQPAPPTPDSQAMTYFNMGPQAPKTQLNKYAADMRGQIAQLEAAVRQAQWRGDPPNKIAALNAQLAGLRDSMSQRAQMERVKNAEYVGMPNNPGIGGAPDTGYAQRAQRGRMMDAWIAALLGGGYAPGGGGSYSGPQ